MQYSIIYVRTTDCSIRVYYPQLLTAATAEAEQHSSKQSLLAGHNDKVIIHKLRAVGLISSSGVCESVVSHLLLHVRNVKGNPIKDSVTTS